MIHVEAFRINSDQAVDRREGLDVDHSTCAWSASWCPRTDLLFDVPGMHVLSVDREPDRFVLTIESDVDVGGCPSCGVVAVGHGRRRRVVADAPVFGVPVRLVWLARLWRCREPGCPKGVFTERHDLVPPRAKLTSRAVRWATDALTFDDTTVSALARHLGVDCTPAGTRWRWRPSADSRTRAGSRACRSSASTNTSGDHRGSATLSGR
jgi:transposase